ncbi:hypothetical protein [Pelagibacterium luteolum]|uniref:Uncharacterized protein n=1 Tax=Pelagibacterium luteolum TaxID=440168 RepID=A0A1G7XIK3_9HYPH|nr:hypothetical protein [Pelagibacterium luteolum]SDG84038.1 hypothetical protein SAMN04487974_109142 [Pelagibacterium luteolum]
MAKTLAERRRYDRDRKRRQRQARREAGVPSVSTLNAAIAEGLAFAMRSADRSQWGAGKQPVDLADIFQTAQRILVNRHRCNPDHVREALKRAASPRPEHGWPSYTQSMTSPDDGRQHH